MKLDLLQSKLHKITSSDFILNQNSFSFDTKIADLQVRENKEIASFVLELIEPSELNEIVIEKTSNPFYTIEYSHNNVDWYQLPFRINEDKELMVYSHSTSASYSYLKYESNTKELITEYVSAGSLLDYTFIKFNTKTRENENLYTDLKFTFLKFTFFNVVGSEETPFKIKKLYVYSNENLDESILTDSMLKYRADNIFTGRMYEDQPFLRDVKYTYLNMLNGSSSTPLDIYKKTSTLHESLGVDRLLDNTFSFKPTVYNTIKKVYEESPETVEINNDDNYLNLHLAQYSKEYTNLVHKIQTNTSIEYKKELIAFILKNSNTLNHLKGSLFLVNYTLRLYAKLFGYYIISIIEEKNFVYRITTSIPTEDWEGIIKDMVHPCGWICYYNHIPYVVTPELDFGPTYNGYKRYYKVLAAADTTSYLEGDKFFQTRTIINLLSVRKNYIPNQTVLGSNNQPTNGPYKYDDLYGQKKLQVKLAAEKNIPSITYINPLQKIEEQIYRSRNYSFNYDGISNETTAKFKQTGIAIQYIWKQYDGNRLVNIFITPTSVGTFDSNYRTELTLWHQTWNKTVHVYRKPYVKYKGMDWIFEANLKQFKVLSILASNLKYESYSGLSFNTITSEMNNQSLVVTNDLNYDTLNTAPGSNFDLEFNNPDNFIVSNVIDKYSIQFIKTGIATKYVWLLYMNSNLVHQLETDHATLDVTLPNGTLDQYSVILKLKNGNFEALLNNAEVMIN